VLEEWERALSDAVVLISTFPPTEEKQQLVE
jgi:hypothetical protein